MVGFATYCPVLFVSLLTPSDVTVGFQSSEYTVRENSSLIDLTVIITLNGSFPAEFLAHISPRTVDESATGITLIAIYVQSQDCI